MKGPEPERRSGAPESLRLRHLGSSGLRIAWGERGDGSCVVDIDPPEVASGRAIITWSETERVAGARPGMLAAAPVLSWLGMEGIALDTAAPGVGYAGFDVSAIAFTPIPWATPTEAVRKGLIGLRSPGLAVRRLSRTLRRPADPPLALLLSRGGFRIALLGQALHRFQKASEIERLVRFFGGADVLVAGTDFDDEAATAALMERFGAGELVLADLIGPVRRALGLPTRPLDAHAHPRARLLREGGEVEW